MKRLPLLLFLCSLLLFISCKTSSSGTTTVSNSNSSKPNKNTPPKDKGEAAFEEYLEMKKGKFVGKLVPSYTITTINGKKFNPAEMKGKIVLLNFWFAACKPCITEIPSLNELHTQYASKGLVILSVSTDDKSRAAAIAKEKNIKYKVAANGKSYASRLEATSFPTSFLIDQEGIIHEVFIGSSSFDATQTYYEIKPHLEKLLKK